MRVGVSIAQVGRLAEGPAVRAAAQAAERIGYSSVWVLDRLLAAVEPRSADPVDPDGRSAAAMATALDPIGVLTLTAGVTTHVRLGTSVLVAPWYKPVLLARSLATLDRLSDGRLTVGFGLGWSIDEREAVGIGHRRLGARLEETLDVLEAVWGADPVSFEGLEVRLAPALVSAKPLQRPRPPILLAGTGPSSLDRVARRADGWNPAGLPVAALGPMWSVVRDAAHGYGRDPDRLSMVVRADVTLTDRPRGAGRAPYEGSLTQVVDDLRATGAAGASEVILGLRGDPSLDEALDAYARISEELELGAAPARPAPESPAGPGPRCAVDA